MGGLTDRVAMRPDGWLWPVGDTITWKTVQQELDEIPALLGLCKSRRTVVQAGGNGGLWVRPLAEAFERVMTFEPDPVNFRCLVHNVPHANVTFTMGALGPCGGEWGEVVHTYKGNPGAHHVKAGRGATPIYAIDEYMLTDVDLLQLDIEGAEMMALKGAVSTIEACKPVICVELRGHAGRFGNDDDAVRSFLRSLGYRMERRMHHDEFWIP
jgi:FkbM family methyltransferase